MELGDEEASTTTISNLDGHPTSDYLLISAARSQTLDRPSLTGDDLLDLEWEKLRIACGHFSINWSDLQTDVSSTKEQTTKLPGEQSISILVYDAALVSDSLIMIALVFSIAISSRINRW